MHSISLPKCIEILINYPVPVMFPPRFIVLSVKHNRQVFAHIFLTQIKFSFPNSSYKAYNVSINLY